MSAETFRRLISLGLSNEQIAGVLEVVAEREAVAREEGRADIERSVEKNRQGARARWHKWNDKRLQTFANSSKHSTRVEGSSSKNKISGGEEDNNPAPTAQSNLEAALDAERAAAVVEHRKKIGKPLTPHAGALLAAKFAKCDDPNVAADEMVANGWQGFKPEWLEKSVKSNPQAAPRGSPGSNGKRNYRMAAEDRINGHGREGIFGGDGDAERFSAGEQRPRSDAQDLRSLVVVNAARRGH